MPEKADFNLLCWGGYEEPALLDPFAAEHGITARGETFVSDSAAAGRLVEGAGFDVANLNNPFARDLLYPQGVIRALEKERFAPHFDRMLPEFRDLYRCGYSADGTEIIGVCQRFGPFNLVVDTRRLGREAAEEAGFELPKDPALRGRYGVLEFEDFNLFHIAITAGIDPFVPLGPDALAAFERTARLWFEGAALVTSDPDLLNRALVQGEIDFYLSGGLFSASPVRRDGVRTVCAVTPRRGPIAGKGAIVFMEVTSAIAHPAASPHGADFLEYILRPEVALRVALAQGSLNPVAQMGDPAVMRGFSRDALEIIQWESLAEDVARCAHYRIPPDRAELRRRLAAARRAARPSSVC